MNKDSIIAVRHAIVDDSLDLWHWRNDDLTRKISSKLIKHNLF